MNRRTLLSFAPAAIVPALSTPTVAATPAGPRTQILRFPLKGGAVATLRIVTDERGDDEAAGPLFRATWTVELGPGAGPEGRLTLQHVFSATPSHDDARTDWTRGSEGREQGWDHFAGSGYVFASQRAID